MANKKNILSTAEFLAQMRKTPIGSTTTLTFGDAQALANAGIDTSSYGIGSNEYVDTLEQETKESQTWWDNIFGTIDNIANSFGKGFVGAFEGIADAGVWLAGEIGSWFGADTKWAEDIIKFDVADRMAGWTEMFTPWAMIKNSVQYGSEYWNDFASKTWWGFLPGPTGMGAMFVSDEEFAEWQEKYTFSHDTLEQNSGWFGKAVLGVSQAAGQLVAEYLGAKGIGIIAGKVGKAANWTTKGIEKAAKVGTLSALGVSAAGGSTQAALQDGADYQAAGLYGLLSGATEVGTEMIGGVLTDVDSGLVGKLMRQTKTGNKILNKTISNIIMNGLSEGFEEVLSDIADPLWKKLTIDPELNLGKEYTSKEFWSGLAMSFTVGSVVGAIGSAPRAYRASKFTINGIKGGAVTYNAMSEFNSSNIEFKERATAVFRTVQDIELAGHEFAEGTDFRTIAEEIKNANDINDKLKNRFEKAMDRAIEASNELNSKMQDLDAVLQEHGITETDLIEQYGVDMKEDIKALKEKLGIDIVEDSETYIDSNGNVHIATAENVDADVQVNPNVAEQDTNDFSLEKEYNNGRDILSDDRQNEVGRKFEESDISSLTPEQAEQAAVLADAVVHDKNDLRQLALKFETEELREKWAEKARQNPDNINKAYGVQEYIDNNVANDILSAITKDAPIFTTTNGLVELSEILKSADSIEEAREIILANRDAKTSDRIDAGNKANKLRGRTRWSSGVESFFNKTIDAQYALRSTFKQLGMSETKAEQIIGKAVSSTSVGMNIASNGYYHIEDGHIVMDSVGIYGTQSDGIVNRIQEYAKANNLDFHETLEKVERIMTLEHSIDRVKQGKTVFGKYVNNLWVNKQFMAKANNYLRPVYNLLNSPNSISEAEWNEFKRTLDLVDLSQKDLSENDRRIGNIQREIIKEVESHFEELSEEETRRQIKELKSEITNYDEIELLYREFMDQVLQSRVDAGMMTQEMADEWKKMYPHYVPTYRVMIGSGSNVTFGLLGTDLRAAKGSNLVIQDIFSSSMRQAQYVNHFAAVNDVLNQLYEYTKRYQEKTGQYHPNVQILSVEDASFRVTSTEEIVELSRPQFDSSRNTVTLYKNGQAITMQVSPTVWESLENLDRGFKRMQQKLGMIKFVEKTAQTMRQLMTNWNPFFSWWRNPLKDIQSAVIYTKNGTATLMRNWVRSFGAVFSETFGKGENATLVQLYKIYIAEGGQAANITALNMYEDIEFNDKWIKRNWRKITSSWSNFNEIMENTTRFAEFLSTYERLSKGGGLSQNAIIQEALNDAREITINFARKGTWTQVVNKFVPFLTANIEGAARNIRAFISPRSKKELAMIIIKMLILGIAPQLIQEMVYGGDEDYQSLNDTMKSNYYLFKIGTEFIRIPKGYIQQAFSSAVVTVSKKAHGENIDWDDIKSMLENQWNAVGVDVGGVFFQPIIDAKNNRTWYGAEIVPQKYDNTRPSEQYDRNTSYISRWLGKITGISPLKIDYVLDQMTGIVGDILLPATSENGYNPLKFIKDQFVTDSVYKNRYSSEFYDYKQNVIYDKTDGDVVASVVASYLNRVSNKISDLKKQQDELIDADLSQAEKAAQDKVIQATINATYKAAIVNAEKLKEELAHYELSEESIDQDRIEAYRQTMGAEFALEAYNSKVYAKAQCYYKAGVSYDEFYVYYFNMKNLPDRSSVENYIARLRIKPQLKNLLYRLMGYKLDNDKIVVLTRWLKLQGLTEEEIEEIL